MITLPCLGGTNRQLTTQHDALWYTPFLRDERGQNIHPLEFETYHRDSHPELGDYWRHESLTTPEAVEAALPAFREWKAVRDADSAHKHLFGRAEAGRAYHERMDPLNVESARSMLPVLRGEQRSNQWLEMDRSGWGYALNKLNQRVRDKRLKRADTVKLDACEIVAWYDWRAHEASEGSAEIDHAVLINFIAGGEAYWWGNEHAILDLMEPA